MILGVYSVLDKAVNAYLTPFYARSDAEAVRSFSDACMDVKHQFCMHPHDYALYRIGSYNDMAGEFENGHVHLVNATSYAITSLASAAS